ncbi:hypothetical protein [Clostridium perfringens]|uniref:hypothetical protein n=1 Tax=Clostridium perfringens TaxID=1502 RepID=UPI0023414142|nr:hypothetical protein [Clostridium perfringens]MDC4245565.1 hypothetical protein [Clostridium perfringens]
MKNVVLFTREGSFKVINLPQNFKEEKVVKIVTGFIQEKEGRIITAMDLAGYTYMTESQYKTYLNKELKKGFATKEDLEKNYTIIDYKEL